MVARGRIIFPITLPCFHVSVTGQHHISRGSRQDLFSIQLLIPQNALTVKRNTDLAALLPFIPQTLA